MSDEMMKLADELEYCRRKGMDPHLSESGWALIVAALRTASAEPMARQQVEGVTHACTPLPKADAAAMYGVACSAPSPAQPSSTAPDAEIVAALEDQVEAGAQALVNDHWHPPQPLYVLNKSEANRYRRHARLVLEAALAKAKGGSQPEKPAPAQPMPIDLAEECAKIAESHVGALGSELGRTAYDEACRDIAKAIRDVHGSRNHE